MAVDYQKLALPYMPPAKSGATNGARRPVVVIGGGPVGLTLAIDVARYGTPVVPALERAAIEIRLAQRRALEERARKLPVQLLFPLVFCCLPAFALLTVAPFVLTVVGDLTTAG